MTNVEPTFSRKYQQRLEPLSSCKEWLPNLGKVLSPGHLEWGQHTLIHCGWGSKAGRTWTNQFRERKGGVGEGCYFILSVGFITRDCNQHAQDHFPICWPIYSLSLIHAMVTKTNALEMRVVSRDNATNSMYLKQTASLLERADDKEFLNIF